jgi:hypothetical protein
MGEAGPSRPGQFCDFNVCGTCACSGVSCVESVGWGVTVGLGLVWELRWSLGPTLGGDFAWGWSFHLWSCV